MLTSLLVSVDDCGPHVHLKLLLRHVLNGVPQLSIRLLRLIGVFEVDRALEGKLLEEFRLLDGHLPGILRCSLVDGLIRLELDL